MQQVYLIFNARLHYDVPISLETACFWKDVNNVAIYIFDGFGEHFRVQGCSNKSSVCTYAHMYVHVYILQC
jgi:hypothetical protein